VRNPHSQFRQDSLSRLLDCFDPDCSHAGHGDKKCVVGFGGNEKPADKYNCLCKE
jgi:hypothetical protein